MWGSCKFLYNNYSKYYYFNYKSSIETDNNYMYVIHGLENYYYYIIHY